MASIGGTEDVVQKWKVPELKSYLQSRGITVSQKRKEELVELVEKARDLSLEPIDDLEKPEDMIVNKLQTKEGSLPCPNTLHSDWTSDFSDFPNFTYGDMYAYLINKEGYDHECLKAYKSFEGYRLFWDGHVLKLMKNKNLFNGYHYVKFGVKPTEREKTQVGQKPTYDGWLIIQSDGSVYTAHCPCTGGADGACRHIGASLIDLEATLRENVVITCTGRKCTWKQRKRTHEGMTQALDMDFTKPTMNKEKKKRLKPRCDTYDPRTSYDANLNLAENFRKLVAESVPSAVLLHLLPDPDTCNDQHHQLDPENLNDIREENPVVTTFTLDSLSPMKPLPPSLDEIKERGKAIKRKLQFTDDEIDSVEKKTKLQSDSIDWFKYRTGRITASHCKRIASLKSTTSPTKALKEVLSYNQIPLTAAMKEGLEKEDEIEQALIKYMKQNGHCEIRVEKCGFVISKTHGHIGASPDRIMYDQSESTPGVVEMKFLQVKSGETLEDILLKQHICIKRSNGIALNRNHKYFYQLHQQMFATTYPWGIFVACGRDGGIYVEKVLFDQDFWSLVLVKLDSFFESVILPELAFPKVKYGQNRTVLHSTDNINVM